MKQFPVLMAVVLAGSVLWSGCGKKEEAPPPALPTTTTMPATPTATPVAPAAPVAEVPKAPENVVDLVAGAKDAVAQAMAMAKDGKYQEALALLQKAATEAQDNPAAMKLINDSMAQIKQMMADAATKAATDKVGGALGGLGK